MSQECLEYPDAQIGAENLRLNNIAEAERLGFDPGYTPPSRNEHYRGQYPWDSWQHIMVYSKAGGRVYLDAGRQEFETLASHQQPSGQIYNELNVKNKRRFDLNYLVGDCLHGQPPLGGLAGLALYNAMLYSDSKDPASSRTEATNFMSDANFNAVAKEAFYYLVERRNSDEDYLIFNVDPGETGRDEAPDFDELYEDLDFIKLHQIPRSGDDTSVYVNDYNTVVTQLNRILLRRARNKAGASLEAQRDVLSFNDIEFNCLAVFNAYTVAQLAQETGRVHEAVTFKMLAQKLETQILSDYQPDNQPGRGMWNADKGMFYSLKSDGQPLARTHTVANSFALLLPNIRPDQLRPVVRYVIEELIAEHGIASVALSSPECDPGHKEKASKWHGSDWGNQKYFISEGARMHINRSDLANEIDILSDLRMILNHCATTANGNLNYWAERNIPIPEFSGPHNREAQRKTVEYFGWSNLGRLIISHTFPSTFSDAALAQSQHQLPPRLAIARAI